MAAPAAPRNAPAPAPAPVRAANAPRPSRNFQVLATTQAEEDAYDIRKAREAIPSIKFTSLVGSVAHMVKGALGGGILSGHVSYMKGGVAVAIPLNLFFGMYMGFCLYLLVTSAQVLYRRARIPIMSYADVGEAATMMFPNTKVNAWARPFRYFIDLLICIDLFGSCCCYQIIIAKSLKQLVEDTQMSAVKGLHEGYPSLRVYLAAMIPLIILICLIKHLKYLAPFSIAANFVVLMCIFMAIYYAFKLNPGFQGMKLYTSPMGTFEYIGMSVFSMSCAGVVIPIENNMQKPEQYPLALAAGMGSIIICVFAISFSGYAAFLEYSEPPITLNFPMTFVPKLLKGLIAGMIYVTHALNFWVPFNLCFYYIKRRHNPASLNKLEFVYRAIFVTIIGIVAIVFPDINAIMGFIGCFCLSNMAFIWPATINLLVIWHRPGLGAMKWRLWRGVILLVIGIFIFICGSIVNAIEMVQAFIAMNT